MAPPLDGIRILDFTRYQAGAHGTAMLADMGADVLKVEVPGDGDPGRSGGVLEDGFCTYFEANNRGKRSITLDLRKPEAVQIVRELLPTMDVLAENFRNGVMDKLELSYEAVKEINPRIVYASQSGFGPKGPWANKPAFDPLALGMSGAMVSQGGGPGKPPIYVNWGLADMAGSIILAYGIVNALFARERLGVGQRVDTSMLGAMVTVQNKTILNYLHTHDPHSPHDGEPSRRPNRGNQANFGWFEASDGEWFNIASSPAQGTGWPGLCRAVEREDLLSDPRCADPFVRRENAQWLYEEFRDTLSKKPRQYWLDRLMAEDVPCAPIYDYPSVEREPQFWENGYLTKINHPQFGEHSVPGIPVEFSETPGEVRGAAPELGQHTEEVLLELGYGWADIERLHDGGVIAKIPVPDETRTYR